MEWAGLDPGGLRPEKTSDRISTHWLLVDVKQLKAYFTKTKEGINECFPFLFGNNGKMTELGVSLVFFPSFFFVLHSASFVTLIP